MESMLRESSTIMNCAECQIPLKEGVICDSCQELKSNLHDYFPIEEDE